MLRPVLGLMFVGLVAAAFAACGGGDDSSAPTAVATKQGGAVATSSGGAPQQVSLVATDFAFTPNKVELNGGTGTSADVTIKNNGQVPHNFQLYSDKTFKKKVEPASIGITAPGSSGVAPFSVPAKGTTYFFRCELHPDQMQGQIDFK